MRRKSERTATKKAKPSPEKKVTEKLKRTRTSRRRKQSTSSEESPEDNSPLREPEATVAEVEKKPPQTPTKEKEVSPEDAHEVWHVKTAEVPSDTGEIQKLKICLTRPPSTPERVDRSPRSRRKHSRATSSSDTPSVEATEDRKKKHRSKRAARASRDEAEPNQDSQGDEAEADAEMPQVKDDEITQSTDTVAKTVSDETPMSTTSEEHKIDKTEKPRESEKSSSDNQSTETDIQGKSSDADTTVVSPQAEARGDQTEDSKQSDETSSTSEAKMETQETKESQASEEKNEKTVTADSKPETEQSEGTQEKEEVTTEQEVSKSEDNSNNSKAEEPESSQNENAKANDSDVVDSSEKIEKEQRRSVSPQSMKHKREERSKERRRSRELERSESTQSTQEEPVQNGQVAPIVVSRKRRWGSRSTKLTTQKSITISTDVLKEIIPDVKPVEFEEVIEEKKQHKRVLSNEKVERPVLPKIVIDNTEHVEHHKKEYERESENVKSREPLAANRRISIVKENDSIIARPPSPPRHKQSCILYITNLVRPFTLPQLKNLLQRTGRISEDGFWIDRIKSKCFVKYETEDQAVETRHALHGVTWPVSNPKTLQVDFSTQEAFDKARANEETDNAQATTIPGTVEDWLREQDMKRERGEVEKPWERKAAVVREWDFGKNDKDKDKERPKREERGLDKRRHRTPERSPEPAKKFKKKEEEAPAKLLDDLFRKTKTTPCIYWLPLSAEMIAIKEEQRRQHMAEHERRLQELRRTHRRH